jgi:hypothetical protein
MRAPATMHVNKIAAASRQLDAAIRMFFAQEDELAIHTLVSAAFRVLRDIFEKRGKNFTAEVFRKGIYSIARRYAEGNLPEQELKLIKHTGLMTVIENIRDDVRAQGDSFDLNRIGVGMSWAGEQKAWPSKAANFLKHADRDTDEHLILGEINNENILMGACAAYLQLMATPTPEIMAFCAFWGSKNDAVVADVGEEAQGLSEKLKSVKEPARYYLCADFIREARK